MTVDWMQLGLNNNASLIQKPLISFYDFWCIKDILMHWKILFALIFVFIMLIRTVTYIWIVFTVFISIPILLFIICFLSLFTHSITCKHVFKSTLLWEEIMSHNKSWVKTDQNLFLSLASWQAVFQQVLLKLGLHSAGAMQASVSASPLTQPRLGHKRTFQ